MIEGRIAKRALGGLAGLDPGEWVRTSAIITTDANELVTEIHHRMLLIVAPGDYGR